MKTMSDDFFNKKQKQKNVKFLKHNCLLQTRLLYYGSDFATFCIQKRLITINMFLIFYLNKKKGYIALNTAKVFRLQDQKNNA